MNSKASREIVAPGLDAESSGSSDEEGNKKSGRFVNPLSKPKKIIDMDAEMSEGSWSSDNASADGNKKDKKDKSKLGKRKRGADADDDDVKGFFNTDTFAEVPADHPGNNEDGYESMDSTGIAEMRILAKKMLRKKERSEILDATYNRYSFHEDPKTLPTWFVEDEGKNYWRHHQPTKEEVVAEKEEIKAYNARTSKKVEQAKNRKKKRMQKAMDKIKQKANVVADQDINERSKMKQIMRMYAKEREKQKEETKYVFNRSF